MGPGLTVVKSGGAAQVDPAAVCAGVADLARAGRPVVLVHGGSAAVSRLAQRLGVRLGELASPGGVVTRRTDEAALEVLIMALAGQAKPALLVELAARGVSAVGLTGLDAGTLTARTIQRRSRECQPSGRLTIRSPGVYPLGMQGAGG